MSATDPSNIKIQILQLASRLDDASSNERLDAIQSLHSLARQQAQLVGEYSLNKLLEILREHGSVEEYQDVLDLIIRLVSSKDKDASIANTNIILSQNRNVDLFLDLLEHEDMTIGVMTSQILSEIHHLNGDKLESEIQSCPEGMMKLLRRLPDTSREEVRDQALVFVQQLTCNNEEMKKNFVFNEGFEIIFKIIQREQMKSSDISVVIQDCLLICYHVLTNSEICQRLFYGMGQEWINVLEHFFDPENLESYKPQVIEDDGDSPPVGKDSAWYNDPKIEACSVYALGALANSLAIQNIKHQNACIDQMNASNSKSVLTAAAFWLARRGPSSLLDTALSFLLNVMKLNPTIGHHVLSFVLALPNLNLPGKSIPPHAEAASLYFSWRPFSDKDIRYITLSSLIVERYIYKGLPWSSSQVASNSSISDIKGSFDLSTSEGLSDAVLKVIETWLEADSTIGDLIIQYALAPPPPLPEEFDESGRMTAESSRPIGKVVLTLLSDSVNRLISINSLQVSGSLSSSVSTDVELVERACNVMAVVFVYGTTLAKELSTAVTTQHLGSSGGARTVPLLTHLLSSAGRLMKSSSSGGISVVVSILRLLAVASSGCERVVNLLFEDPSNLFVVDLASIASENAGVSQLIQLASCFLIGCCYQSLPKTENDNDRELSRRSFMNMIDTRIGLQRFTDIIKRPLQTNDSSLLLYFFRSNGFRKFYEAQNVSIRKDIFEHYTGSGRSSDNLGSFSAESYEQIIQMQRERIEELEKLAASPPSPSRINNAVNDKLRKQDEFISSLQQTIANNDIEYENIQKLMLDQANHINQLESLLRSSNLREPMSSITDDHNEEIVKLKKQILDLVEEKKAMSDSIVQRDKKLELLEVEALSLSSSNQLHEKKVVELEARNSDLRQQVWVLESEIKELKFSPVMTLTSTQSPPTPESSVSPNHDNWKELVTAVEQLVVSLELPIYDPNIPESENGFRIESFFDIEVPITKQFLLLADILHECSINFGHIADRCSDMTQGLSSTLMNSNILVFESDEKSRYRIEECFEKLLGFINDVSDQCQLLESSLADAEAEKSSIVRMNERLEEENRILLQDKQPPSQNSEYLSRITELEEQVRLLESNLQAEKDAFASAGLSYNTLLKQETDNWQQKYHGLELVYKESQERYEIDIQEIRNQSEQMKQKYDLSLREATQALAEAKRDLNQSRSQVSSLDEQLQQMKKEELILQSELQAWKNKCDQMEVTINHENSRDISVIQELETKIQEMDKLLLQREEEHRNQMQQNHENIVQKCLSDLSDIEAKAHLQEQEYEKKLLILQTEIEAKDRLISQLEEKRQELVEDMMSLEAAHDMRLDHLNKESEEVKQTLFKLSDEYTAYKKENEDQKSKVINHYEARISDLETQLEMEKDLYEQTISQHQETQASRERKILLEYGEKLEKEFKDRFETLRLHYESEKEQLRSDIYKNMAKQIQDIRDQEELLALSLKRQLESSMADLMVTKEELLSLRRKYEDMKSENSILMLQQESLSLAEQKQQFILSRQNQEQQARESDIHNHEQRVRELESQIEQLEQIRLKELKDLEGRLREEYSKQITNLENQLKIKQNVLDGLKSQLQNEKVNSSDLREKASALQDDVSLLKLLQMEILSLEPWFRDNYNYNVNLSSYINSTNVIAALKQAFVRLLSSHQDTLKSRMGTSATPVKGKSSQNDFNDKTYWPSPPTDSGLMSTTYPFTPEQSAVRVNGSHEQWTTSSKKSKAAPSSKKDLLRLQAEILRERKKYVSLQEEHNDLLGLLAQQEVELSVIRDAMERSLGADYLMTVDEEAMRIALDRYGNYINFRGIDQGSEEAEEPVPDPEGVDGKSDDFGVDQVNITR